MINKNKQSGFSLLEVMMAVVVLMMGMVFVASMFPVGLHNSRINVDNTMNSIEAHNSDVNVELIIDRAHKDLAQRIYTDYNATASIDTINEYLQRSFFNEEKGDGFRGTVHFIPRPNMFVKSSVAAISDRVFITDLEFEDNPYYGRPINYTECVYYQFNYTGNDYAANFGTDYFVFSPLASAFDPMDGVTFGPSAVNTANTAAASNYILSNFVTSTYKILLDNSPVATPLTGDIGRICCPVIDESSPEVNDYCIKNFGSNMFLNHAIRQGVLYPAIQKIALEQKYNWAVAYSERDNRSSDEPIQLYIFILKQIGGSSLRYPVQNPAWSYLRYYNFPYADVITTQGENIVAYDTSQNPMLDPQYDCRFPVPWLVYIDQPYTNYNLAESNSLNSSNDSFKFTINTQIGRMLLPDTYIIDADPEPGMNISLYNRYGDLYKIKDVKPVLDGTGTIISYEVTLYTSINTSGSSNSLFRFWFFPPAYNRTTGEFADEQPVIDVIQKPYWYKN